MKTDLNSLNEYLFEALNRITNEDLEGEALQAELERSKATTDIAKTIIDNGRLMLSAAKLVVEEGKMADVGLLGDGK